MTEFIWRPCESYDSEAVERMIQHFPQPMEPMGEAWFMGERRIFTELTGDLNELSTKQLIDPLYEIASGTGSFGASQEWHDWFHYLLGRSIPRASERHIDYLLESLITGFISQYPHGVEAEPYAGFLDDSLNSLGRSIMDPAYFDIWEERHWREYHSRDGWVHVGPPGALSASLFFCAKYLPLDKLEPWLRSIFQIEQPLWRAHVMGWFVSFHGFITGEIIHPTELGKNEWPPIDWEASYIFDGRHGWSENNAPEEKLPFLSSERRMIIDTALKTSLRPLLNALWVDSIDHFSRLKIEAEMIEIQENFYKIYLDPQKG